MTRLISALTSRRPRPSFTGSRASRMRLPRGRGDWRPNPDRRTTSPWRTTARLRKLRLAHSRRRSWTEGHPLTTTKPHDSELPEPRNAIAADADDGIRQFIKHFELHLLDASRALPPDAGVFESHVATA